MRLFGRNKRVPLSKIIDGVLTALNEAREMQRLRQMQLADTLTDTGNGKPVIKRLKIGDQEIEIPLSSLVSRDSMEIKEVNISFQIQIRDLATRAIATHSMADKPITYNDLEFMLHKVEGKDEKCFINILFQT